MSKPTAHARLEELIFDALCSGYYYSPLGAAKRAMADIDAEGIEVIDASDLATLRARLRRVQRRRRELLRIVAGLRDAVVVLALNRVSRRSWGNTAHSCMVYESVFDDLLSKSDAIRAARRKT